MSSYMRSDLLLNARYVKAWTDAIIAANTIEQANRNNSHVAARRVMGPLNTALRAVCMFELPGESTLSDAWLALFAQHERTAFIEAKRLTPHEDRRNGPYRRKHAKVRI